MVMPFCSKGGDEDMFFPSPWNMTQISADCYKTWRATPMPKMADIMYGADDLVAASNIILRYVLVQQCTFAKLSLYFDEFFAAMVTWTPTLPVEFTKISTKASLPSASQVVLTVLTSKAPPSPLGQGWRPLTRSKKSTSPSGSNRRDKIQRGDGCLRHSIRAFILMSDDVISTNI